MRLPIRFPPAVGRTGRRLVRALAAAAPRRPRRRSRADAPVARRRLRRALPQGAAARRAGRPLAALAIVLVASLGMGANSPSSELTANRVSGLLTLEPVAAISPVALLTESAAEAEARTRAENRPGADYYRQITRKRVAPGTAAEFVVLYREAQRVFGVNWRLIASVHRQETAFSQADTTYHGLNDFGCCAGPMQFNVTNGPVSTWDRYRQAFRAGKRPGRYPHRTDHHPSIYDDFDAIMAAGSLLRDSGAGPGLDGSAWTAAYAYYGHDLYGITYASQVAARAASWERNGFCANCEPDAGLVDEFDTAYGAALRQELLAAEKKGKKKKKSKKGAKERAMARDAEQARVLAERAARRDDARRRESERQAPAPPPPPAAGDGAADPAAPGDPATDTATTTTPAAPPAAPPPPACSGVRKLLGC